MDNLVYREKWLKENPEYYKEYYKDNAEKLAEYHKLYAQEKKEKIEHNHKLWRAKKSQTVGKLASKRNRIAKCLEKNEQRAAEFRDQLAAINQEIA